MTQSNELKIKVKLEQGAIMPTKAHSSDSGYDMHVNSVKIIGGTYSIKNKLHKAANDLVNKDTAIGKKIDEALHSEIVKKMVRPNVVVIDTGVAVEPPDGYYFEGFANSRSAKRGYILGNCVGVIDQGYRGTIKFIYKIMPWCSWEDYERLIEPGSVCGQIVLKKKLEASFVEVESLTDSERGKGGFGSTEK